MIILRQKSFAYVREVGKLGGTGNIIKDIFSSPNRIKKANELSSKSLKQWENVAKKNAPGTKRREIADKALIRRGNELENIRTKIETKPWAS